MSPAKVKNHPASDRCWGLRSGSEAASHQVRRRFAARQLWMSIRSQHDGMAYCVRVAEPCGGRLRHACCAGQGRLGFADPEYLGSAGRAAAADGRPLVLQRDLLRSPDLHLLLALYAVGLWHLFSSSKIFCAPLAQSCSRVHSANNNHKLHALSRGEEHEIVRAWPLCGRGPGARRRLLRRAALRPGALAPEGGPFSRDAGPRSRPCPPPPPACGSAPRGWSRRAGAGSSPRPGGRL